MIFHGSRLNPLHSQKNAGKTMKYIDDNDDDDEADDNNRDENDNDDGNEDDDAGGDDADDGHWVILANFMKHHGTSGPIFLLIPYGNWERIDKTEMTGN